MDSTLTLGAFPIARGAGGEAVREREPRRAGEASPKPPPKPPPKPRSGLCPELLADWQPLRLRARSDQPLPPCLPEPSRESRASDPPPTSNRKIKPSSMLTSVRASCIVPQNPFLANVTILVEYKATAISTRSGTVASRVTRPINSRVPHTISTTPTNGAITCGHGMPIFTKRPTPKESGNRNFWMPSDRNTQPTRTRISKIAFATRFAQVTSVFNAIELSPHDMQGNRRELNRIAFRRNRIGS